MGDGALIRFVRGPDGVVVPDLAAKLPGRGVWVRADAASLALAVKRNAFARGLKADAKAAPDLAEQIAAGLRRRVLEQLGLGRKAGALALGMDQVQAALKGRTPPTILIEAADGASDGRAKVLAIAKARDLAVDVIGCFAAAELGMALGRDHVVHVGWLHDRMAQRWAVELGKLSGFCALAPDAWLPDLPRRADLWQVSLRPAAEGVPAPGPAVAEAAAGAPGLKTAAADPEGSTGGDD